MIINFGDYLPDQPVLANSGLVVAKNAIPYGNSYQPFPSAVVYSNALNARCQGFISVRDKAGDAYTYGGDASALYRLSASTFVDASRTSGGAYATAADESWEFAQWGENVVATNYADTVQIITLGQSNFAALTGSPPKARHIAVVRDFLLLGNVTDYSSGAAVSNRIHWSGLDSITSWTPSFTTQSDYQDFYEGGWVQKVVGGETGIIFQERSIRLMTYIGSPVIFQFDEVEKDRGTPAPNSVINLGANIYYLGQDDFYVFNRSSASSTPIGGNRVYQTFVNDLDPGYYDRISGAIYPTKPIVLWAYPGVGNANGNPNRVLIYNWALDKWAIAEFGIEMFSSFLPTGYTLDGLDAISGSVDALAYSLDSRVWSSVAVNLAAFDTSHKLVQFTGTALEATFETGEKQMDSNGGRALVTSVRPLVDGGTTSVQVATRNLLTESASYAASSSVNTDGECPVISEGRYHRFKVSVTGGFNNAQGVEVDAVAGGRY